MQPAAPSMAQRQWMTCAFAGGAQDKRARVSEEAQPQGGEEQELGCISACRGAVAPSRRARPRRRGQHTQLRRAAPAPARRRARAAHAGARWLGAKPQQRLCFARGVCVGACLRVRQPARRDEAASLARVHQAQRVEAGAAARRRGASASLPGRRGQQQSPRGSRLRTRSRPARCRPGRTATARWRPGRRSTACPQGGTARRRGAARQASLARYAPAAGFAHRLLDFAILSAHDDRGAALRRARRLRGHHDARALQASQSVHCGEG
jgi:hypothetical protein